MSKYDYIEDIFLGFFTVSCSRTFPLQPQDRSAVLNFYEILHRNDALTENQSKYILKILDKYKVIAVKHGIDYQDDLLTASWKQPFRIIDYTKKISVEKDEENRVWIIAKFPYSFKNKFEKEFSVEKNNFSNSRWDPDRKIRKIPFYEVNTIAFYNFCRENEFEIDESFLSAVAEVEEIWNRTDEIENFCIVENNSIHLNNASSEILDFFQKNKKGKLANDLLLAKSMGFPLKNIEKRAGPAEIIAATSTNIFWLSNFDKFFNLTKDIDGKICILIDRVSSRREFLQEFVAAADKNNVAREEIKVCHRESNQGSSDFNDWVKTNSLGGKVSEGKYLIFNHKPSKWLFQDSNSVKIIVTNAVYPDTNPFVRDWINYHDCVFYIGTVKPTLQKERKIVEL